MFIYVKRVKSYFELKSLLGVFNQYEIGAVCISVCDAIEMNMTQISI